jgi:replicative DNA helicase
MIDFSENIESLEKMVWNFILNEDNENSELKPKNSDALLPAELIILIKPSYFNEDNRCESYKQALKFFKEHKKIPNKKELGSQLELVNSSIEHEDFEELYTFNLKAYSYNFLYKYVKAFVLLRNLNLTIFDILSFLKTARVDPDNIDKITEQVRNDISNKLAINFSSGESGLNFMNPESHIQISKKGTPSGFTFFDKTQGGGWNEKSLVVFQGRPKVGKSYVLGNIAARSFLIGNTTGLVTVELSERKYMKRIGASILSITGDDYQEITNVDHIGLINKKLIGLKKLNIGKLYVKEFPTGGATAIDIENYFLRLESKNDCKFKVIVVDYLNLLQPIKEKNGLYEKIKSISEELRGVAMRNSWCIISATQVKRDAVNNFDLGMESVAESFGLIHTVDALYGIMRSPLEGRMKIKVIANRDNGYEESYKFFNMEKDYFRLVEEVGINSEFYSDDEDLTSLEEEVRNDFTEAQATINSEAGTSRSENYDDLFNSL